MKEYARTCGQGDVQQKVSQNLEQPVGQVKLGPHLASVLLSP